MSTLPHVAGDVDLVDAARASGLRQYLHGVNAIEARQLLADFLAEVAARQPPVPLLRPCPAWLEVDDTAGVITIHGRRYSVEFFGPQGIQSPPGTVFRIVGQAGDVTTIGLVRGFSAAAADVMAERDRQICAEGWSTSHDDGHDAGELSAAASAYALAAADELHPQSQGDGGFGIGGQPPNVWPWAEHLWKPTEDPRRMLVKAGALNLAEIERMDRCAAKEGGST